MRLLELNPFESKTSGCLFDWSDAKDSAVLHGRAPFEFRVRKVPLNDALALAVPHVRAVLSAWATKQWRACVTRWACDMCGARPMDGSVGFSGSDHDKHRWIKVCDRCDIGGVDYNGWCDDGDDGGGGDDGSDESELLASTCEWRRHGQRVRWDSYMGPELELR